MIYLKTISSLALDQVFTFTESQEGVLPLKINFKKIQNYLKKLTWREQKEQNETLPIILATVNRNFPVTNGAKVKRAARSQTNL